MIKNGRLLLILLILTGCCSVAPNPRILTPRCHDDSWEPTETSNLEMAPPPTPLFDCEGMDLCALIDTAVRNNPETWKSWEDTLIAASQYGQELAPYYPALHAKYDFEAIRNPSFFGGNMLTVDEFREWGPAITLQYLLFDWGTTRERSEAARHILMNANWMHNRSIQSVIQMISNDYYAFNANREKMVASEANLHDAEVLLDVAEKRQEFGLSDVNDVLSAKTQVAKRQVNLLNDVQLYEDSEATLIADLGLPANIPVSILEPNTDCKFDEKLPEVECFITDAYKYRPDLYAQHSIVRSYESKLNAAENNQMSKVFIDGDLGKTNFNGGFTDHYDYSLQMQWRYPIFTGFWYQNQIREACASLEQARAEMRDFELQMVKQVVQSYNDLTISSESVTVNQSYVEYATESYEARLKQYQSGTIDFTTLTNALTALADARYSLVEAKRNWFFALTNLAYATGILANPKDKVCL